MVPGLQQINKSICNLSQNQTLEDIKKEHFMNTESTTAVLS